jgi:hypothetical protein
VAQVLTGDVLSARLAGFIAAIRTEEPAWGVNDCGHLVTRWAAFCLGTAPARHGDFTCEANFGAWIAGHGGMLAYADRYLTGLGCTPVAGPSCGDIGLVEVLGVETMAIKAENGWFMRAGFRRSMRRAPANAIRVWRLPCHS